MDQYAQEYISALTTTTESPNLSDGPLLANATMGDIYLHWERKSTLSTIQYKVLRSSYIDGSYQEIATVDWPQNEYIDKTGNPSCYYKIKEVNVSNPNSPVELTTSAPMSGEEILILDSLMYQLGDLLNIPIYDEDCIFGQDRTKASFAFNNWNHWPRPEIRISSDSNGGDNDPFYILSDRDVLNKTFGDTNNYPSGLKYNLDYKGKIFFLNASNTPQAVQNYDSVYASYHVRLFTGSEINNAAYLALQSINAQPGAEKYPGLQFMPFYYDPAIVSGACYFLLRGLMLKLTQRETRLLIYDPEEEGINMIDNLKEMMRMYKEDFDGYLKSLPIARYPDIRSIVTPEYMMPGGRSRFFRYAWKGGA